MFQQIAVWIKQNETMCAMVLCLFLLSRIIIRYSMQSAILLYQFCLSVRLSIQYKFHRRSVRINCLTACAHAFARTSAVAKLSPHAPTYTRFSRNVFRRYTHSHNDFWGCLGLYRRFCSWVALEKIFKIPNHSIVFLFSHFAGRYVHLATMSLTRVI